MGIRHPLQHLRGNAVRALRGHGLQVDVLGEDLKSKTIEVVFLTFPPQFLFYLKTVLVY